MSVHEAATGEVHLLHFCILELKLAFKT
jgi:hypothetical protein